MSTETRHMENWYQNPWVWFVILIPFSAVAFGIVMIVSATSHPDDVVVDNYYQEGKAINQRLEMDERASERHVSAVGRVSGDSVIFEIDGATDSAVVLHLYHVTDSNLDHDIVLLPEYDNRYSAEGASLPFDEPGVWYVELVGTDDDWRLRQRVVTPVASLELSPK